MKRKWSSSTTVFALFVILLANNRNDRSFVTGAAISNREEIPPSLDLDDREQPGISDADVKQLESLKHSLGKTLAMMKSQSSVYTDINGQKDTHASTQEEVSKDGDIIARISEQIESHSSGTEKPVAKVRLDVDVGGVHKTIQENVPVKERRRQQDNNVDVYSTYSTGIQYSPLDMAEYVFWTGDEKGVTSAIQEFLRDGLMSHDEAIGFLEEIKFNLEYLQAHYSQQGGIHSPSHRDRLEQSKERAYNLQRNLGVQEDQPVGGNSKQSYDIADLQKDMEKKSETTNEPTKQSKVITASRSPDDTISDEEYEILLERLRVADFLYTQYSLEEVIYQLAKVMFSQSLTRGSAEAQEALQKFTTFLESETEQGHISRTLEKKVLDVLIAALTDTLTEHPELVAAAREGLGGGTAPHLPPANNMLQQILEMTPEEKEAAKSSLYAAFKEGHHYQTHLGNAAPRAGETDRLKLNKN